MCSCVLGVAPSSEAGKVMDNNEGIAEHHLKFALGRGKLDHDHDHCNLHVCTGWYSSLSKLLHALRSEPTRRGTMEFLRKYGVSQLWRISVPTSWYPIFAHIASSVACKVCEKVDYRNTPNNTHPR